jgi:sugar phosphate isomerase/epimerase
MLPMPVSTRRQLLGSAGAAAFSSRTPLRLGGPVFLKTEDPGLLAREHRRLGYRAAYCPPVKPGDTERQRAIEQAFRAHDVVIAEVGAWVNMLDPDPDKRRANLQYVTERLAVADAIGARCCVDIAGSFNPDLWYAPHPRNITREYFDATVENCRTVIDGVKSRRTVFAIEMSPWNLPDSPDESLRLLKAVDRAAFGVHLDVCNLINSPRRIYDNAALSEECFTKLGRWIASCHGKDVRWVYGMQMHFEEVIPGRGELDYRAFLRALARYAPEAPLMHEHLKSPGEYDEGKRYVLRIGSKLGLSFG